MTTSSKIEWTDATWNPVAGCSIVSPGCQNCYAMRMASRLEKMGQAKYAGLTRKTGGRHKWNGEVRCAGETLREPMLLRRPSMIFVNSMSDLFHESVPIEYIKRVFSTIEECPQHIFQILTKRSERLEEVERAVRFPPNSWIGVSVESSEYTFRIDHLKNASARVRFISFEPLLADVGDIDFSGIAWAIVGGESGPGARPMSETWVRSIRDQCLNQHVAFHFKQWGGVNKKQTGRILDGRTWDEFPSALAA